MFSVNLPRASSLYGSTSNLSSTRAFRGSNPNLASQPGTTHLNTFSSAMTGFQNASKSNQKTISGMVRSSSSSSFTSLEQSRQRQRQDTARSQVKMGSKGMIGMGGKGMGIMESEKGVMGMSTMELGDGNHEDRGCKGEPNENFLSQIDLSPESRGKPALKRTTGDFHSSLRCNV